MCVFSPGSDECVARNFGHGSVVCECNSTHCDSIGSDTLPALGQFLSFTSSKAGSRLQRGQGQVQNNSTGAGENSLGWRQQPPLAQGWETKKTKACTHCYPSGPVLTTPFSPSQFSGWLWFPTRSTRGSEGLEEPWQTQLPSTSCLCPPEHRTSYYDSTSLLRVRGQGVSKGHSYNHNY